MGFQFINEYFFCEVKENKGLCGDVLSYVAQGTPQFDPGGIDFAFHRAAPKLRKRAIYG